MTDFYECTLAKKFNRQIENPLRGLHHIVCLELNRKIPAQCECKHEKMYNCRIWSSPVFHK